MTKKEILKELSKICVENNLSQEFFDLYVLIQNLADFRSKKFEDEKYYCFASNRYFSEQLCLSTSHVVEYLFKMVALGLIKYETYYTTRIIYTEHGRAESTRMVKRKIFPLLKFKNAETLGSNQTYVEDESILEASQLS